MTLFKSGGTVAVFDVDETLIPFKSMFVFLKYAMKSKLGKEQGAQSYRVFRAEIDQYRTTFSREEVNRIFYRVFKGWSFAELEQLALSWWRQIPSEQKWIAESVEATPASRSSCSPAIGISRIHLAASFEKLRGRHHFGHHARRTERRQLLWRNSGYPNDW